MPNLPIDAETKEWIDTRTSWILDQFGHHTVRSCTIVTPTTDFFPNNYRPTAEDARELLDRLCGYMKIDPASIDVEFYSEQAGESGPAFGSQAQRGTRLRIGVEESLLDEPPLLAATLTRELSQLLLLETGRVTGETDDYEPLTDLLPVYLGLGISTANSALHDFNRSAGTWETWQVSRHGCLTLPMFGYALALFSHLRFELQPDWPKHLRPDVRHAFVQSVRYLEEHGLPDTRTTQTASRPSTSRFESEPDAPATSAAVDAEPDDADGHCSFCDAELSPGDIEGICAECRLSIDENQRDIEADRLQGQINSRRKQSAFRLGCGTLIAIVVTIQVLEWLGMLR